MEDAGSRTGELPCPGCGAALVRRRAGSTLFDECDHCSGVWLTPPILDALSSGAESRAALRLSDSPSSPPGAGAAQATAISYRRCPDCGKMMNRTNYALGSGVVVDVCRTHGSWFDAGELSSIIAFIEGGGLERARRRELERLEARASEAKRRAATAGVSGGADLPIAFGDADASPTPGGLDLLRWLGELLGSRI